MFCQNGNDVVGFCTFNVNDLVWQCAIELVLEIVDSIENNFPVVLGNLTLLCPVGLVWRKDALSPVRLIISRNHDICSIGVTELLDISQDVFNDQMTNNILIDVLRMVFIFNCYIRYHNL